MIKKRNGAIDFWRFVFAAILVIFHTCMLDNNGRYAEEGFVFPMPMGSLAVEFFLLTSGFLFAKSMNRSPENDSLSWTGTWRFLKGKLMGFYPAYVICLLITFVGVSIVRFDGVRKLMVSFMKMLYELLLLRNFGFDVERLLDQAWYLSSMMLAMLLLYPIYAKNKRLFERYIAPTVAVFLLGYLFMHDKTLLNPSMRMGFTFRGNLRVVAEICLGVGCYRVCEWFKQRDFTLFGRILLALIELFGYVFAILYMHTLAVRFMKGYNEWYARFVYIQYTVLLLLAISVIITFSEKSIISPLFNHGIFRLLGRYSLYPYLLYAVFADTLPYLFPGMEIHTMIALFLALTFAASAAVMALHMLGQKWLRSYKARYADRSEG